MIIDFFEVVFDGGAGATAPNILSGLRHEMREEDNKELGVFSEAVGSNDLTHSFASFEESSRLAASGRDFSLNVLLKNVKILPYNS